MDLKELIKQLSKKEGKKSQVKIGDIREIVGILSDIIYDIAIKEDQKRADELMQLFVNNGEARAIKKKK